MAKKVKKTKRYLRGRLVPFISLCCSLAFILFYFGNFIAGEAGVNGFNAALGILDWPILSGFNIARDGVYYQEFFNQLDLSLSPFAFDKLLSVIGVYLLPLSASFALISAALNLIFSAKNLLFGKMKIKFEKLSLGMLIGSVLTTFSIPALSTGQTYFEGFGDFITFKAPLRAGVFGLLTILSSILLFIFPYFVRAMYRINYRINTLEQDSIVKASDKTAYKRKRRYDKGYKSFR